MQSIFGTLVWETLLRGRWLLPIAFLGGNLVPILVLGALARQGISVSNQPDFIILHLVLSQVNMMIFAFAIFISQGKVERLFTSPISNRRLVAYHLLIGMAMMFTESALSTFLVNALYGAGWPIWGPALFGATALAVVYAAAWLADRSLWVCVEFSVVASLGAVWFRTRFVPSFRRRPTFGTTYRSSRSGLFWRHRFFPSALASLASPGFVAASLPCRSDFSIG